MRGRARRLYAARQRLGPAGLDTRDARRAERCGASRCARNGVASWRGQAEEGPRPFDLARVAIPRNQSRWRALPPPLVGAGRGGGSRGRKNAAQWVQVIEAYSMMVAGASALPSTMSGSGGSAFRASITVGVGAPESASAAVARNTRASATAAGRRRARSWKGMGASLIGDGKGAALHVYGRRGATAIDEGGPAAAPPPPCSAWSPLCPVNVAGSANGRLLEQPPVAGSEPVTPQGGTL